jgi:hypothetical protein
MSGISFLQCLSFIERFEEASVHEKTYLSVNGSTYETSSAKKRSFRTTQIADLSKKCLDHLRSEDASPEHILSHIDLLSRLGTALNQYADKVKNAVEHRWWYPVLHFFGFTAKRPQQIDSIWKEVVVAQQEVHQPIIAHDPQIPPPKEIVAVIQQNTPAAPVVTKEVVKTPDRSLFGDTFQIYEDLLTSIAKKTDRISLDRIRRTSPFELLREWEKTDKKVDLEVVSTLDKKVHLLAEAITDAATTRIEEIERNLFEDKFSRCFLKLKKIQDTTLQALAIVKDKDTICTLRQQAQMRIEAKIDKTLLLLNEEGLSDETGRFTKMQKTVLDQIQKARSTASQSGGR